MQRLLTPEEKIRIEQEEILRAEIHKVLVPPLAPPSPQTWQDKLWRFLNSTFGIWLLSTVVVASVVNMYNSQQAATRESEAKTRQEQAEFKATREIYQRITLEIAFRFSSTMTRLKAVSKKYGQRLDAESQKAIADAFDPLYKPATDSNPPLYPEYKFYSGMALIAELQRHAGDAERITLTEILAKTSGFIEQTVADKPSPDEPAETIAAGLLQRMSYSKWSNNGFPYTRCDASKPFC